MKSHSAASREGDPANQPDRWRRVRRLARTISVIIAAAGVASAGIGYIMNGAQFFSAVTDYFQNQSELRSLIAQADERLGRADYETAWRTNAKVRELAPRNEAAAEQQSRIAMKWLQDAHVSSAGGPQTFGELVEPLKAALVDRAARTQGAEKANVLAHIGWANFLRYRDGRPATDIVEEFDAAIAADPGNVYGHAMRGFWSLWNDKVDEARADLDIALSSGTDHAFSDSIIMTGFTRRTSDKFEAASIEYANKIRLAGRNLGDETKSQLLWSYSTSLRDKDLLATIGKTLPPAEQILLIDWLAQGNISDERKRVAAYFTAYFLEQDGQKTEAIRRYDELVSTSSDKKNEIVARMSQDAVRRLRSR